MATRPTSSGQDPKETKWSKGTNLRPILIGKMSTHFTHLEPKKSINFILTHPGRLRAELPPPPPGLYSILLDYLDETGASLLLILDNNNDIMITITM